jgi:hypothetical protein
LPSFESHESNLSLGQVDPRWKSGTIFRHIVLKSWFRSDSAERRGLLFAHISLLQKNLLFVSDGQDLVVPARDLYKEWVSHRMSTKSISKIIVVENLFVNGN